MNKTLALIFCIGTLLAGCSSKPDISDINTQIEALWEPCKLLEVIDLKKTNGFDQGSSYTLTYSYKLKFLSDFSIGGDGGWPSPELCPAGQINILWEYAKEVNKRGRIMKKAEFIEVNDSATLIKSEKGWVTK